VDVLGRAAAVWGSRGPEFKSRQPDQYTPPHPTWSDLHSTDILKAGCPTPMTSASQPVASRKVAVMITPPRAEHESFLRAAAGGQPDERRKQQVNDREVRRLAHHEYVPGRS
jgi:hypothetical protein